MTRLSNGFSRKRANLRAALALYFAYYNLCRMHELDPHDARDGGRRCPQAVDPGEPPEGGLGEGDRPGTTLMPHYPPSSEWWIMVHFGV